MQPILATFTASISELKMNPSSLEELELTHLVQERLKEEDKAIEIALDDL